MRICLFGDARSVHIQRLATGLAGRGLRVHVVTHKPADIPGVSVERFRIPRPTLANARRWRGRWEHYLRGFLRGFDVVNIHFLSDWGFTPEVMRHGCVVASAWGSDVVAPPGEEPPSPELTASRVSLLRHADAVTTCGPTFAGVVAKFAGIDIDRIDVVPFGVDLQLFRPSTFDLRHSTLVNPRVGFFKGFREVSGTTDLIAAIPIVLDELPATRFDLVGDGPQLSRCQALADELGVAESIEWIPRQPHRNLPSLLAGWDLTVIPSVCEAFGVAALESSAMRVPVVASAVGGLCDTVLDGRTGLLVPPQAPEQLARAVTQMLKDASLRSRMGQAGRELVERKYDSCAVLDKWVDAYERALALAVGCSRCGA